jgi:predicted RNA-binding protein with PUA-like domain
VKNAVALRHLRGIQKGDEVLVYHSGADKAVVGIARATTAAYADPKARDPKLVVVDLEFVRRVKKPVTLAAIKSDPSFAAFELVRMSRLSVMPVPAPLWKRLLMMAGES